MRRLGRIVSPPLAVRPPPSERRCAPAARPPWLRSTPLLPEELVRCGPGYVSSTASSGNE
eukprot:6212034-Pleurochrysis_carterae.AAC.2